MKLSAFDTALVLVKHFEGFRATTYRDPVGVLTIGYGETGPRATTGATITEPEAAIWLSNRLLNAACLLGKLVDAPLRPENAAALLSFIYNVGDGAFARSTMRKRLNEGDFKAAAAQFTRWNKAGGKVLPGLVKRREAERRLFLGEELEDIIP